MSLYRFYVSHVGCEEHMVGGKLLRAILFSTYIEYLGLDRPKPCPETEHPVRVPRFVVRGVIACYKGISVNPYVRRVSENP